MDRTPTEKKCIRPQIMVNLGSTVSLHRITKKLSQAAKLHLFALNLKKLKFNLKKLKLNLKKMKFNLK